MKKQLLRVLVIALVICMILPVTAMAASTTWIYVSIENDESVSAFYKVEDESSHYLTDDTNLLYEVVQIIMTNYHGNRKMYGFASPAMQDIMDEGLNAYKTSAEAWYDYVEKYYADVNPVAGDVSLKAILRDRNSVLGDLEPNVAHKISFKNEVVGDPKYGETYIVTVIRYGGSYTGPKPEHVVGTDAALNKDDHIAYINGYPQGDVRPNNNITREEVAMIFYRLMTRESRAKYETTVCSFSDVEQTRWSRTAIATLANAGILDGYPGGTFAPKKNMTRAEFAAVATRFDALAYTGADLFPDIAGHWAADEINSAAYRGWIVGDNGYFRPQDNITRAEAVTMINRVLDRKPEVPADLLTGMKTFTDNLDTSKWYYLAVQEAANGHDYMRKADGIHESWTALHP